MIKGCRAVIVLPDTLYDCLLVKSFQILTCFLIPDAVPSESVLPACFYS